MNLNHALRELEIGAAHISIVTSGSVLWRMVDMLRVPTSGWKQDDLDRIMAVSIAPFQSTHISIGEASVVVDAMDCATYLNAHSIASEHHQIMPRLDQQLAQRGISPTSVTHLILTHAHDDHYNVATVDDDEVPGYRRPLFPSAVVIAERVDWTPEGQRDIFEMLPAEEQLPDAAERFMGELFRRKMVLLVEGDYNVAPGIRLVNAPGETPGHAVVRVYSKGKTLYCIGDLFHDIVEVEHPEWVPHWVNPEATVASRKALIASALAEDALLVAAHIPGVGRLYPAGDGVTWVPVK